MSKREAPARTLGSGLAAGWRNALLLRQDVGRWSREKLLGGRHLGPRAPAFGFSMQLELPGRAVRLHACRLSAGASVPTQRGELLLLC